jgi:hypothetical protein
MPAGDGHGPDAREDLIPASDDHLPPEEDDYSPPRPADTAPLRPLGVVGRDVTPESWRPMCRVDSPAHAAEWLRIEAGAGPLAGVFRRGYDLVHCPLVGGDGYREPDAGDDGPAQIRVMSYTLLASRIQWTYMVHKVMRDEDSGKKVMVATMFPKDAARVACEAADMLPNVRPLRGVIHSPIVRIDGSVLADPGYDDQTGLLYLPDPALKVPPVPAHPTSGEIQAAVGLLDEMTAGFRFLTPSDRANYYGLLLTPLLRELVPPPYKLGAIGAPMPGSGKTLLATVLRIIHGGVFRPEMPADDEEFRKVVTTILDVTTGPVAHIDNVSGVLRSSTLAALLTSSVWEDRRLGSQTMVSATNDRLWVLTGNNVTLGGDLVRRTVWVTIDPGCPDPHLRTGFAIADLEGWARRNRGRLLHALLVLIRAWVAAGRKAERKGSDGYAQWVGVVDGILTAAGVAGTFSGAESARQSEGSDDDDWADFLEPVRAEFEAKSWTVKELLALVHDGRAKDTSPVGTFYEEAHPIHLDALPAELVAKASHARGNLGVVSKSLGRFIMNRRGRWARNMRVVEAGVDNRTKSKRWRIETVAEVADRGRVGDGE